MAMKAKIIGYGVSGKAAESYLEARGIETVVVSEAGERFNKLVPPALKYTDICCINEIEASRTTGVEIRDAEGNALALSQGYWVATSAEQFNEYYSVDSSKEDPAYTKAMLDVLAPRRALM